MTIPATKKSRAGVVLSTPAPIQLNKRKLGCILDKLYLAIVHSRWLYASVKMSTHAPQHLYYPGSPEVQLKKAEPSPQHSFITEEDDSQNGIVKVMEEVLPELHVLDRGTPEQIRWLWFATLTDRREDSMKVYKAHCRIYADHPEFYNREVLAIPKEKFKGYLGKKINWKNKYKIGSPAQSSDNWLVCAKTLFEEFDGDPVKLLKHAGWGVEAVYAWKHAQKKPVEKGGRGYDPIPGWGRKLLSLYFLYLSEFGYPLPEDAFASDVHSQAMVIQVGALNYGDRTTIVSGTLAEHIRKFITEYCKKKGYDVVLIAHASWLLGSNLCDQCSKRPDAVFLCPIYDDCSGRVDTSHYWKKGQWPKGLPVMNKGGNRPPFGVPTDVVPKLSQRGTRTVIPIAPLFPSRQKLS